MKRTLLFSLLFTSCFAYSQVDLNLSLVAYYPFNGNANDVSGNNINGVVNNATLTTDRDGLPNSAYYFNGTSSFIQLPYSSLYNFAPNDSFTLCVRILPDQGNPWPAQSLVVKSPFTPDFNLSLWNYGTYMFNYKAMSGYAYNNAVEGTTVFTGIPCWYNIITTYKNGIWKLYINGVLEDSDLSQTRFILQDGAASKINFGRKGDSNGDYYKGKMDEIRIYHRLLNQQEIDVLSSCSPIPVKLTGFYASVIDNKKINLTWNTEEEIGIKNYTIERAASGTTDFISVGTALPKNGGLSHSYVITDNTAKPNILYNYRLAITDHDGSKKYSEIKTAKIINKLFYTSVYPNPSTGLVKVDINNPGGNTDITVLNDLGQAIITKKINIDNAGIPAVLDLTKVSKGIYWIIVQGPTGKTVEKLIIQ